MIPIFAKLLVMSIEARSVFGDSSNVMILRYDGCFLVLSMLMSLYVSEKNATSDPATRKEITNRTRIEKIRIVVAPGVIKRKFKRLL